MDRREQAVRRWFGMWLSGEDAGMETLFSPGCVYIESWGPEYHGIPALKHWFAEWNTRGRVLVWNIIGFLHSGTRTAVEWHFENVMEDGSTENFDGMSLIEWDPDGKICRLTEFGCKLPHYDPYSA